MPICIERERPRQFSAQIDEALEIVHNEFSGLDPYRQYRNAFARLLKTDPLGRVYMMGTDQRDLFVPELRRVIGDSVPAGGGHIFDFGAGDGQTFALVAAAVPTGTVVSIEEPNPHYVEDYWAFLATQAHLRAGVSLTAGFDGLDKSAAEQGVVLPADGSIDLVLAMHMLYFVSDVPASLARMVRFLKPGGSAFVVVTDETIGYTGLAMKHYRERGGRVGDAGRSLELMSERRRLFGKGGQGSAGIVAALQAAGLPVQAEVTLQPSRLYGHNLADLVALCAIAGLAGVEDLGKFDAAAALLREAPGSVDLRVEDQGPRAGMWSVLQPQWVAVIRAALRG
ncbi:MAG: methyltransferase domain-containing protein [Xanthomonadales bacterium]|nr:methyltransferase domain-containing protein [Xanthomonadales bacterium]